MSNYYTKCLAALMGIALAVNVKNNIFYVKEEEKKPSVCRLPECKELTYHHRGYCSAEHCKKHQEIIKQMKRKKP